MLAWLQQVMDSALENNERVILIYHVPSGYFFGIESSFKPVTKIQSEYHSC